MSLVEDHARSGYSQGGGYWSHVYLSPGKAKAGVEHWAVRVGCPKLRWSDLHDQVATEETVAGSLTITAPAQVAEYQRAFQYAEENAVYHTQAAEIITAARAALD